MVPVDAVELLHLRVRVAHVGEDGGPGILEDPCLHPHPRPHVVVAQVGLDEAGFEAGVDPRIGGVPLGVRDLRLVPSVEVDRGVMGLGEVGDEVPQDPGIVHDPLLEPAPHLRILLAPPPGEAGLEALVELERGEGREAHGHLGILHARLQETLEEVPPVGALLQDHRVGDVLQVDVVVVAPRLVHFPVAPVSPPVGLGVEPGELVLRLEEEGRHPLGEGLHGGPGRHFVAHAPPGSGGLRRGHDPGRGHALGRGDGRRQGQAAGGEDQGEKRKGSKGRNHGHQIMGKGVRKEDRDAEGVREAEREERARAPQVSGPQRPTRKTSDRRLPRLVPPEAGVGYHLAG